MNVPLFPQNPVSPLLSWNQLRFKKPRNIPRFLGEAQSKGLNAPEKLLFDLPSPCPLAQTFPEVSHKVTCVQHQMFNSACACQSTLKMQVALGAHQPGPGGWHRAGNAAVSCQAGTALILPNSALPWDALRCWNVGQEAVPGFAGLLCFLVFALCFSCPSPSPSPAGFSSPEAVPGPSGDVRLAHPSEPFGKSQSCVCVQSPGTDRSQPSAHFSTWLCNSQGKNPPASALWKEIQTNFWQPSGEAEEWCEVQKHQKGEKRFCWDVREKTQLWSSTLGLYENTGNSRCVLCTGQVLELEKSCLFPLKQPTELYFFAFQSFQGSQGRAYLFNSVWVPCVARGTFNKKENKPIISSRKPLPGTWELPGERGRNSPWFMFQWCRGCR